MPTPRTLAWREPLELGSAMHGSHWVLLYSGAQTPYSGRYSYLACDLAQEIEGKDFKAFERVLSTDNKTFSNAWFGMLGYGLKDGLEKLARDKASWPGLPNLCMMRFHTIYCFDHVEKKLVVWSDNPAVPEVPRAQSQLKLFRVAELKSNMSRKAYLAKAREVIEHIQAGDLYQANLTRKFQGKFEEEIDPFVVFCKLCSVSPAPYSAFVKMGETAIVSSSPEQFLNIDAAGTVRTRPIKGTAPRYADPALDQKSREALAASTKDRAENLMIVDLMRNDLARSCDNIEVTKLFEVTSHATIHHMSSTITGKKRPGCSTLDAVKFCFPPGSMTGAPKISAINLCSALEVQARGVYSGAIGWFGGDGSADLSVVIRTLVMKGKQFEFQVGGGIVADSKPELELSELIDKSTGITSALGISREVLEEL